MSDDELCPICFDPLASRCRKLPCSHIYHIDCIDRLVREGFTICSICSAPIPGTHPRLLPTVCSIILQTVICLHIIATTVFFIIGMIHIAADHKPVDFMISLFLVVVLSSLMISIITNYVIRFG